MTRTGWVALGIIILIVLGGLLWWGNSSTPQPMTDQTSTTGTTGDMTGTVSGTDATASSTAAAPMTATVMYDGNSFTPANVTIAQGGTVTFTDSNGKMWIASDPHPAHTGYDGSSRSQHCAASYSGAKPFDECSAGSSFSFTFDKTGSFGYHDHLHDESHATITVVAAQ